VACPLLEGIDLSGARGVLVLIAAARANFKLSESRNAMNAIKRYASDEAHIIYGTAYDESLGDALRITVIATGLTAGRARQQAPLQVVQTSQVVRNGTDGMPVLTQAVAMAAPAAQQANVGLGLGDFANANVPSVWRHGRSGSAAAKVEALSSNGMDEIEIPAFLRKQAD
jgi:cell division protein FtsZ